jgi:predicted nucleic acid-binding protein
MPDVRRIVSDTGPLLHLREVGTLDILQAAGQVFIPLAVETEMAALDAVWNRDRPEWIETVSLQPSFQGQASDWMKAGLLDPGEAEAMALANQLHAGWLLTDDTAARLVASRLGLEVHGSLGVVLWAAASGHFSRAEAEDALEALSKSSLWLSARVLDEARGALRQIFS